MLDIFIKDTDLNEVVRLEVKLVIDESQTKILNIEKL